jgi:membrane-bound metal-dependent hydrolase YbcI (DUF457 family)
MNWKGHIIFGIIFLALLTYLDMNYFHFFFDKLDAKFFAVYAPIIAFSFLLPDIDHPSSMPRVIATIFFLSMIIYYAFAKKLIFVIALSVLLLLIWVMNFIPGWQHRGHAHSIAFIFFFSLLTIFINWKLFIVVFFGAFSHLLADLEIKVW